MLSRITTGALRFDQEVDSAALPGHLAGCLRNAKASTVETTGSYVKFTVGIFRLVGNWNVLVPFGSGSLSVDPADYYVAIYRGSRWTLISKNV